MTMMMINYDDDYDDDDDDNDDDEFHIRGNAPHQRIYGCRDGPHQMSKT